MKARPAACVTLTAVALMIAAPARADTIHTGRSIWISEETGNQAVVKISPKRGKVLVAETGGRDVCFAGKRSAKQGYEGRYRVNGKRYVGSFYFDYHSWERQLLPTYWVERPGGKLPALLNDTWRPAGGWAGQAPSQMLRRCQQKLAWTARKD